MARHRSKGGERSNFQAWGRLEPPAERVAAVDAAAPAQAFRELSGSILPFGNGRSYGDVCTNRKGTLLDTRSLAQLHSFDSETGVIRAGAGMLLSELLKIIVPAGWFLPVTPGTKFVTLGGAVANDVHGKNHHVAGTFGRHVTAFELVRSDGSRRICTPQQNCALFSATIGGLGLTGLITWCEVQLTPIVGPGMEVEWTRFKDLDHFSDLSAEMDRRWAYTVSWIDCLAKGRRLGRGWLMAGNHAGPDAKQTRSSRREYEFAVSPPISLVNTVSLRAFNFLYYRCRLPRRRIVHYEPFFYPLDRIRDWNRMYGPRGFYQFQCVMPPESSREGIKEVLTRTARDGHGSFLAVLKQFGDVKSPGLLSFPRPGATLALDFPNRGEQTVRLLRNLEDVVMSLGGALYPAKDAVMSAATFDRSYPEWRAFDRLRDPACGSDFWERVTADLR